MAKVWIAHDGAIELDGRPADLEAVRSTFAALAKNNGRVLYGRDVPESRPPPNGLQVLKLVTEHHLPIRFCMNRDFSDGLAPPPSP